MNEKLHYLRTNSKFREGLLSVHFPLHASIYKGQQNWYISIPVIMATAHRRQFIPGTLGFITTLQCMEKNRFTDTCTLRLLGGAGAPGAAGAVAQGW
jgi:hypothetical protein